MQPIEYDQAGRMQYHPDFHPNHGKSMTLEEKAYLCRFWETDGPETMAYALGRTSKTLSTQVHVMRKIGSFKIYASLWDKMVDKIS